MVNEIFIKEPILAEHRHDRRSFAQLRKYLDRNSEENKKYRRLTKN